MDKYKRLFNADIVDWILTILIGTPLLIIVLTIMGNELIKAIFFILILSMLIIGFVLRDLDKGRSLGKRIFKIQLVLSNNNLNRNEKRRRFAKRNLELAFEMAFDLFLLRYKKRLKTINKKHKVFINQL